LTLEPTMSPWIAEVARALDARPPVERASEAEAHAAVALVLDGQGELLFIERAQRAGDPWSGHVAFPGGRREPSDRDLLHTAMRETEEEVGLTLGSARLLGALDDLPALGPRRAGRSLVIRPYVFALVERPPLRPNVEVAGVRWWPLQRLVAHEGRGHRPYVWGGQPITLPTVDLGGAELWGLSLHMVDELLERMGRPPPTVPLRPST
jgi:8-oxo-dGTP pyrophosphatase MutT (NUDIX family)